MFKCDCDMNTYIGETERSLLVRIKEHRPHNTEHRDSHIKSHLTLPCEKYFSTLALLHGPNPRAKQKDDRSLLHRRRQWLLTHELRIDSGEEAI